MRVRAHKYEVMLSEEQRQMLNQILLKGQTSARELNYVRILLKVDCNAPGTRWSDTEIAAEFKVSRSTVINARKRFLKMGLSAILSCLPLAPLLISW